MTMQLDHSKSVMEEMAKVLTACLSNTCKQPTADAQATLAVPPPVAATDTSSKLDLDAVLKIINAVKK